MRFTFLGKLPPKKLYELCLTTGDVSESIKDGDDKNVFRKILRPLCICRAVSKALAPFELHILDSDSL
jgi:hypothetical protein